MVASLILFNCANAQSKKQQLKRQNKQLKKEIKILNKLIEDVKVTSEISFLGLRSLSKKIKNRVIIIENMRQEIVYIDEEIADLKRKKIVLDKQLKGLKEQYAKVIVKMYKNRYSENLMMFLLAAKGFKNSFKRWQYIGQYTENRKKQVQKIVDREDKISQNIEKQNQVKLQKAELLENKQAELEKLQQDRNQKNKLLASLESKNKNLSIKLRRKMQKAERVQREIERIIAEEIRRNRNKAYRLTKESKVLNLKFHSNKGKLPWPVVEGVIISNFGRQPHPTMKGIFVENSGVEIATVENAKVRSVFKGKVTAVQLIDDNIAVIIKHGNYYTVYSNLVNVFVKKGEQVDTKQFIGQINTYNRNTILQFQVWKDFKKENPTKWIYKM